MSARRKPSPPGRGPWRLRLWCVAGLVAAVLGVTVWALLRGERAGVAIPSARRISKQDAAVFATYGGSHTCRDCHEQAYALWQASHHAMAERPVDLAIDEPAFQSHFQFRHGTQYSEVALTNGKPQIVTTGPDGKRQAFTPERVLAVNPLRQFLIPVGGGRYQATEIAYDPNHPDWFNVYGEEDRKPGEWGHWTGRGMTWNVMCAACHNTRVRKNYDEQTDTYATSMAERAVGCEACHGPMADHNAWQAKNPNMKGDPTVRKIAREEMFHVCGTCHSRRAELTGDFKPGDSYFDHHALSIPDETDLFYPDGQIRDEDFELTAFLGSRMHASGVRCVDCHEPHLGKVRMSGNDLCMTCHATPTPPAPKIDPATHSFHQRGGAGDSCTGCHMPQTVYMQRHARRDHGFTIPDPLLTKEFGIPNACNRCHDNRDADWAIDYVEKWYGRKMDRPSRERARLLARAKQADPTAVPGLVGLMRSETNSFWRAVSAGFLRRWVDQPAVREVLLTAGEDADPLVRSTSLRSLEPLLSAGDAGASKLFQDKLADAVRGVRIDAAWALRESVDTNSTAGRDLLAYLGHISDQPSGALQRGVFHLDRQGLPVALEYFRRALAWDTNSAPLYHAYAVALSVEGKIGQAVSALEQACRLAPRDAEYQYKLGLALSEAGRANEARAALERTVQLEPGFARAWYNLGLAYQAAGQVELALETLSRAETADPGSAQIPFARATILARQGRIEEARTAAGRALELQPDHGEAGALLRALGGS